MYGVMKTVITQLFHVPVGEEMTFLLFVVVVLLIINFLFK